jgi:hypothetical protein
MSVLTRSAASTSIAFLVLVFIAPNAHAQATNRPIEDFVDTQGTFCLDDGMGGCVLFVPPIENFLGQSDPSNGLLSSVDYAGLADKWIGGAAPNGCGMSFGTTFSGRVTERALADGRAAVHVVLHTNNALAWATAEDFNNPLLFGARAPDVCNGAEPSLGSITMIIDFVNTEPGAPLPDLLQLLIAPADGQEGPSFLATRARAKGELREAFGVVDGTPGLFSTVQNGLFMTSGMGATADGFPVERINLRAIGRGRGQRSLRSLSK